MAGLQVYVDSSVVLRCILNQPGAADWSTFERVVSSELLRVEGFRTLDRLYLESKLSGLELAASLRELKVYLAAIERVPLSPAVLQRAAAHLPTPLGTLDALHLATLLLWTEANSAELTLLTHDRQLALAARACGLEVAG